MDPGRPGKQIRLEKASVLRDEYGGTRFMLPACIETRQMNECGQGCIALGGRRLETRSNFESDISLREGQSEEQHNKGSAGSC